MNQTALYPLRFEPLYQYRLWGGRRLADLMGTPLPGEGPIGEAWLLCDRAEHSSLIAAGPLQGRTLGQLLDEFPRQMLGGVSAHRRRFPLLLKFLDVQGSLSVQVHPSDRATDYLPAGETGKTEAWVVLSGGTKSRVYAGLTAHTTAGNLGQALAAGNVAQRLASFTPVPGDAVYIAAGTVHSLQDSVVFEVQENSDVTFRLFDWNHTDAAGRPRALQVPQAMACIDYAQIAIRPVDPVVEERAPARRERLFACEHFDVWRLNAESPFEVGVAGLPRVLVCIAGAGDVMHGGAGYPCRAGDVLLLPAVVGSCQCRPHGAIRLLEISLPVGA